MKHTTTVIIGAGHSGLAMSRELCARSVDHVILERGQIANSWRKERWDSLRMLSPNWMNGLPGSSYNGTDQDGYMHVSELIDQFDRYAICGQFPVHTETNVVSVDRLSTGFRVQTDQGAIGCHSVVMANGACAVPKIPSFASGLPLRIQQFTPLNYKRPSELPDGHVLIVGASASGLQLAREIQMSGRQVTLAVGSHVRMPRRYRNVDIMHWLETIGVTSIPYTEVDDINRVRRTPSLTLVADETLDLNALQSIGVEITGRLAIVTGRRALFSGSLANLCAAADLKLNRLLNAIDEWATSMELDDLIAPAERFDATHVPDDPCLSVDLAQGRYGSVIWATGYRSDFSWLNLPVFDRKGQLQHDGGVVAPGLFVMGLPFLRQRKSTFIAGAGDDARALANHLSNNLGQRLAA